MIVCRCVVTFVWAVDGMTTILTAFPAPLSSDKEARHTILTPVCVFLCLMLCLCVVRLVWGGWVEQQVWRLLSSASVFIAPLALRQLVQQVGDPHTSTQAQHNTTH